jgi:hypothetical protein
MVMSTLGGLPKSERQLLNLGLHHLSRHGIDRGLSHRNRQPCLCDRTDPIASMKVHTARGARNARNY